MSVNTSCLDLGALGPLSHFDALEKIVSLCDDPSTIVALSCVNHFLNQNVPECLSPEIAFKICSSRLRVINTGAVTMPAFNPFELIKRCHTLAPLVEGDKGLTFLIMCEGLTLRELVTMAAKKGITVDIWFGKILEEIGDIPIMQTYGVLITNNVFKNSRSKRYADQEELCFEIGCEMPTVQEYVALCALTQQMYEECLYGQDPVTYGRSSTHVEGFPLVVGGSVPSQFLVRASRMFFEHHGVGGCQKF